MHNLEHGYVVIWYDSKLPADQVAHLQLLASQPNLGRLLVVGWSQGDLPADKHVVLTSWARTDRCSTVSDSVVSAFYKAHLNASIAPEATLTMAGDPNLPPDQLAAATPARTASPSPTSTKK